MNWTQSVERYVHYSNASATAFSMEKIAVNVLMIWYN